MFFRIQDQYVSETIRKNQGRADCSVCLQSYHLKCLGVDCESSKECSFCSVSGMEFGGEYTDFNIATELNEAIKLRGMKFIYQNICSIRGKLNELNILISQCLNLHILAFTDTWLDNGITDGEISLSGYKIFRSDRPNGKIGGYVKEFKARRSGAEVDWNAYRRLRNQVSDKIKNEKRHYHRNEIQENLNSPKAFWKASKKGNSACPKSIKTEQGYTITDKSIIAEKFNNFFTNAVSKLLETVHQPIVTSEFSGDNFTNQKLCLLPVTESLYLNN